MRSWKESVLSPDVSDREGLYISRMRWLDCGYRITDCRKLESGWTNCYRHPRSLKCPWTWLIPSHHRLISPTRLEIHIWQSRVGWTHGILVESVHWHVWAFGRIRGFPRMVTFKNLILKRVQSHSWSCATTVVLPVQWNCTFLFVYLSLLHTNQLDQSMAL